MRKIRSSELFQKQIGDDRERGRSQQRFERRSRSWDDRSKRDSYRDDRRRESGYRDDRRREDSGYRRREDSKKDRSSDWKKKKQYMKEKGYETRFMQEYVQDQFKVRGLADNTADTIGKIFSNMAVDQTKMTQASDDTNISARFLSKDQKATNEQIVVRLNEYERFMRKIRSSELFQKQIGDDRERGRSQQRFERRSRSWDDRSKRDSYRDDRRRESGYRDDRRREDSGYRRREDSKKDRSSDWKKKKQYKDKKPDKYKDKSREKEKYPRWEIKRIEDNSSSDSDTSVSRDDAFMEADQKQAE
jgi:hypothetical protein